MQDTGPLQHSSHQPLWTQSTWLTAEPEFLTFKEPKNRLQGISSASLCGLAGQYDNPIPTRFLAPVDCLKIPALIPKGLMKITRTSRLSMVSWRNAGLKRWPQISYCPTPSPQHPIFTHFVSISIVQRAYNEEGLK